MIATLEKISSQSKEAVYHFIDLMRKNGRLVEAKEGLCFYVKVTDWEIYKIKQNKDYLLHNIGMLLSSNGNNLHIFGLVLDSHVNIRWYLKDLITKENPKSVSWWNKDMSRFISRRMICHQS